MPERILFRRHAGGLGDVTCTFVALRAARQLYPNAEIIAAYGARYHAYGYGQAMAMGCYDCISPGDWDEKGDAAFTGDYALDKFDRVISLDGPEIEHLFASNWQPTKNRIEVWCDTVGVRPDEMRPRLHIGNRDRLRVYRILQTSGLDAFNYVVVQWEAAEYWKNYPGRMAMVESLSARGMNVVVAHNRELPKELSDIPNVWPLYDPKRPWMDVDLAILCELAQAVICPDSSFLHFAAAVDTPCVGLFSGTDGALTCKYYPMVHVLQNRNVEGKPCAARFPCYGGYAPTDDVFWCRNRENEGPELNYVPWCLEQITPYQVLVALEHVTQEHEAAMREKRSRVLTAIHNEANVKIDRSKWPKDKKTLVVGVPPGIGDLVWPLMKARSIMAEDGADGIHLCIQKTQPARGREFAQRFSFVRDQTYCDFPIHPIAESHILPTGRYNYVPTQRNYLGMDWFWQANGHLEHGGNLADWLPEFKIDWEIARDWNFIEQDHRIADAVAQRIGKPYVVAFIGSLDGNSRVCHNRAASYTKRDWEKFRYHPDLYDGIESRSPWRTKDWIELLGTIVREQNLRVCIVGARYDAEHGRFLKAAWVAAGYDPADMFDVSGQLHIAETYAVIMHANCRCLWSFQSGILVFSVLLGQCVAGWWRTDGDSTEPAQNRLVSFDERMNQNWAPPWSLSSGSYMPLIYARETPRMLYDESVNRGWYDVGRPRGWKALLEAIHVHT